MNIEKNINDLYGGHLRVRVCGFCFHNSKLLLVNQKSKYGDLWLPPGGGLEYGESLSGALKREIKEETNLTVKTKQFMFLTEFLELPLHAIELFHLVEYVSGEKKVGFDPEASENEQLIKQVEWKSLKEIKMIPETQRHQAIQGDFLERIALYF